MSTQQYTPVADIPKMVEAVRAGFRSGVTKDIDFRLKQLDRVRQLLIENEEALVDAVHRDMKKEKLFAYFSEIGLVHKEIDFFVDNLREWAKPEYAKGVDFLYLFDQPQTRREPRGTVLIIGPWNYPLQLILIPLISALAAGNTVVVKVSEVSVHSSALLASLLTKYMDKNLVQVVQGGVTETTELLKLQFDLIFYTGNGHVGKIVMGAATKFLTPVVLELGGKCPAIINNDIDLETTARRIVYGKTMNTGQTCVCIDYLLCHEDVYEKLLVAVKKAFVEYFGENPQASPSYGRIINTSHWDRVMKLVEADKPRTRVICGGTGDRDDCYIAPTILADVTPDCAIMRDEIFGPILPVIKIKSAKEAIEFVNNGDKPLALYVFSKNNAFSEEILRNTSSGGALVNDTVLHLTVLQLPFGGVGASGMGAYRGWHGFETFSHRRALLIKDHGMEFLNEVRYPPFATWKSKAIRMIFGPKSRSFVSRVPWVRAIGLAVIASLLYQQRPLIASALEGLAALLKD